MRPQPLSAVLILLALGLVAWGCTHNIGGLVYQDVDQNGQQNPSGEPGIGSVNLTLTGVIKNGGSFSMSTTTVGNGTFLITQVPAGRYTLTETQPSNYLTTKNQAGNLFKGNVNGDTITDIVLPEAQRSLQDSGYRFGERLKPSNPDPNPNPDPDPIGTFGVSSSQLPLRGTVGLISGIKITSQAQNVAGPVSWDVTGWPVNRTKPWQEVKGDIAYSVSGIIPPGINATSGITLRIKGTDQASKKTHDSSFGVTYDVFVRTIPAPIPDIALLMRRYYLDFGSDVDFSGGDGIVDVYLDDVNLLDTDFVKFQNTPTGAPTGNYQCNFRENFTGCLNPKGAVRIRLRLEDVRIADDGKFYVLIPIRPAPTPIDQQPKLNQARLKVL